MRAFSHSIRFRPGAKLEIRANIPRKVIFSNSVPVKRLVEKTAMRYRIKGTTYILEVARYDEYFSVFAGTTELAETPVTSWGALIFDLQWDNMLGQHANFRLGHTAEWVPSLHTFFPNLDIGGTAGMGTGLEQFVELARRVSLVLSPGSLTSAVKFVSTKPRAAAVAGPARQPVAGSGNSMVVAQGKSWADIAKS